MARVVFKIQILLISSAVAIIAFEIYKYTAHEIYKLINIIFIMFFQFLLI